MSIIRQRGSGKVALHEVYNLENREGMPPPSLLLPRKSRAFPRTRMSRVPRAGSSGNRRSSGRKGAWFPHAAPKPDRFRYTRTPASASSKQVDDVGELPRRNRHRRSGEVASASGGSSTARDIARASEFFITHPDSRHLSLTIPGMGLVERIIGRYGSCAADAEFAVGFDQTASWATAMISDAMADTLALAAADPGSPLAAGLDVVVEQRFVDRSLAA